MVTTIDNAYASVATLRERMRDSSSNDAGLYESSLIAATTLIDNALGRTFKTAGTATTSTRLYTPEQNDYLAVDDIGDLTGLIIEVDSDLNGVYDTTLTDEMYITEPLNAIDDEQPVTAIRLLLWATTTYFPVYPASVRITARWGWPATPQPIIEATILQATRFARRRDAPFGILESVLSGSQERLWSQMDPDAQLLLSNYRTNTYGITG